MIKGWKTYKFSELYETASGLSKSRDQFGFGYPFVTFKNVFYNYFLPDQLGDLANTNEKEQSKGSVKRGDVFLTRTSETLHELGMSSVALKDYPQATFNGFCKRLRLKEDIPINIDPVFMGYYLRSQKFRNEVSKHAAMTTRASLNNTAIYSLEATLPTYNEQVEIGKILKPLDDKIELNLQMNQTLEEMAMTLYKHWFVDFGPFQDGEFVDSELGKIPKGWKVVNLGNLIINKRENRSASSIEVNETYIGLEHLERNSLSILRKGNGADVSSNKSSFSKGDILFGKLRPYFKKVAVAPFTGICSTDILVVQVKEDIDYGYALFTIFNNKFIDYTTQVSSGTRMPRVNWKAIEDYKIVIQESKELNEKFNGVIRTWIKQMLNNLSEIDTLTKTRDTLLPQLISGKVRVKGLSL